MRKKLNRMATNINALLLYPAILKAINKKRRMFFFFPSWSFGGAEKVHLDILNIFKAYDPLCLITEKSLNNGFRKQFEDVAEVIELGRWSEKMAYKVHLLKKLSTIINKQKDAIVFGWGNRLMYELIPYLESHVKFIDLIHNFVEGNEGIEWYSLRYVPRIDNRIVVSKGLQKQIADLYAVNNISEQYIKRIVYIQNKMPFDDYLPIKEDNLPLKILFVSRNSEEKRPKLFVKIAEECLKLNLQVEFTMLGDFENFKDVVPKNTTIAGVINHKEDLDKYYQQSHLLLLTSSRESWGLVIFEGMNFGVVPIATAVGELKHYIGVEKENGILLPNIDDEEKLMQLFVKEIQNFLSNKDLFNKFSKNAFETIKQMSASDDFDLKYKLLFLDNLKQVTFC